MRGLAAFIGIVLIGMGLSACVPMDGGISAIPEPGETLTPFRGGQRSEAAIAPGQAANPPSGFVAFCDRTPAECKIPKGAPSRIALTGDTWMKLEDVNTAVNRSVRPEEDSAHYGVEEYWTVPVDGYGDCEDYVLAKRKMLMLLGVPEPALRISVVLTRRAVRHAVLTVVTDGGDFVLDSMRDDILPAAKTGFIWVERQDPSSRTGWVALN